MTDQAAQTALIICFGDSLTVGYQSPTYDAPHVQETPYGAFLQEHLGSTAQIMISGLCGELTGEMVTRFRRDVLAHHPAYVVILGGTNDLGWNVQPAEIMQNLVTMYEQALAAHIRPVAVTVPSIRMDVFSGESRQWLNEHILRRKNINRLITDYCRRKKLACVDLFTATAEPATCWLAEPYSNDGLHLTTEGYKKLADLLYEQVFSRLKRQTS